MTATAEMRERLAGLSKATPDKGLTGITGAELRALLADAEECARLQAILKCDCEGTSCTFRGAAEAWRKKAEWLQADKERLDWLFGPVCSVQHIEHILMHTDGPAEAREAIDAARKEQADAGK